MGNLNSKGIYVSALQDDWQERKLVRKQIDQLC